MDNNIIRIIKQRPKLVVGLVSIIFIIALVITWHSRSKSSLFKNKDSAQIVTPSKGKGLGEDEPFPTIDEKAVFIQLERSRKKGVVVLRIKDIPKKTKTIDYEISYQTKDQGLQGVIGTIDLKGETEYNKEIFLGTQSSGHSVYHQVVGPLKLSLKFSGDYGERFFEKDFEI